MNRQDINNIILILQAVSTAAYPVALPYLEGLQVALPLIIYELNKLGDHVTEQDLQDIANRIIANKDLIFGGVLPLPPPSEQ